MLAVAMRGEGDLGLCVSVSVCVCVHALKDKRLELSTPNLVDRKCMAVARHALTLRSKGQGHMIIRGAAHMGVHVDMTA